MEVPVGDGGVLGVGALDVDAVGVGVDGAVQDAAVVGALAQDGLPYDVRVTVPVFHHATDLQAGGGGARQAVDRADLRLEGLALPALVPRGSGRDVIGGTFRFTLENSTLLLLRK